MPNEVLGVGKAAGRAVRFAFILADAPSRRAVALSAILLLTCIGCERQGHLRVNEQMTWECAPGQFMSQYPDAQPVRFRFVVDPHYEDVVSGRGLCDQLRRSGKKQVAVEIEAWGDAALGLRGYRELSVDGVPIVDVGGWSSSGATNPTGPHPLDRLFKSNK